MFDLYDGFFQSKSGMFFRAMYDIVVTFHDACNIQANWKPIDFNCVLPSASSFSKYSCACAHATGQCGACLHVIHHNAPHRHTSTWSSVWAHLNPYTVCRTYLSPRVHRYATVACTAHSDSTRIDWRWPIDADWRAYVCNVRTRQLVAWWWVCLYISHYTHIVLLFDAL